ncbi:thiamine phosphate synthase [Arthrobacter sp. I2-34]|uniref:Thiamine-phosphate synthase n=1 Tax=Arthrobacter hankyongi TaxID=2904801 RepID=A0ABS9LCI8_9MICC|nr:thiamine phosphate synthase [Arthrobacter hankyongi]MCG2624398.1 thiamine phosphate synthase [Arthrobacter hankyongi]
MARRDPASYLPLYLVTDTRLCGDRGTAAVVAQAIDGGVTCVQVRDKHATARELLALLASVADAAAGRVPVLLNDRVDVYLAARAAGLAVDGVHIGQSDLPPELVRQLAGPEAIVGLSAATGVQLREAAGFAAGTVDYLGVGAVHPTSTKPDHPEPLGVAGFAAAAAAAPLPCVAIGGITAADAAGLKAAGAAGIAVVSAICAAGDPAAAARKLVAQWN